jgi:lia operon protein LiaG
LKLALAEGSQLTQPSQIDSSDGGVQIRLPQSLNADLDVRASDGSIKCDLPLKLDGYTTKESQEHHIQGHLNGGGVQLAVKTSDGSVRISAL